MSSIDDSAVEGVRKTKAAKKPHGRPKSQKTISAEQKKKTEQFVSDFTSKTPSRPDPKKMLVALSLPEDQQQAALEQAMTPRQICFCKEYIIDFNAQQAALRAGYSPSNLANTSYQLMSYAGIRKLIEFYNQSSAAKITAVDKDYVLQKVTEIVAHATKDSDKLRGLELLARHLGMFIDRTELTGKDGEAIRIEETQREADEVVRKLRSMGGKAAALTVVK